MQGNRVKEISKRLQRIIKDCGLTSEITEEASTLVASSAWRETPLEDVDDMLQHQEELLNAAYQAGKDWPTVSPNCTSIAETYAKVAPL